MGDGRGAVTDDRTWIHQHSRDARGEQGVPCACVSIVRDVVAASEDARPYSIEQPLPNRSSQSLRCPAGITRFGAGEYARAVAAALGNLRHALSVPGRDDRLQRPCV